MIDTPAIATRSISRAVFKDGEVRGPMPLVIDAAFAHALGTAIGLRARDARFGAVVIGRDATLPSVELAAAMQAGLRAAGVDVVDIGIATSPMTCYATRLMDCGVGVSVCTSETPAPRASIKVMWDGLPLQGDGLLALRAVMQETPSGIAPGARRALNLLPCYLARVSADIRLVRPVKVVVDCGQGTTAHVAPALLRMLGCEVTVLFDQTQPGAPAHPAHPMLTQNLQDLVYCLRYSDCELGIAFDGDGDRMSVVTKRGLVLTADQAMMLIAPQVLARHPRGLVLHDARTSLALPRLVTRAGGESAPWRGDAASIRARMQATGALLGVDLSGRLYFRDRWYGYDDAVYAAARLLECLSAWPEADLGFATLPASFRAPVLRVPMPAAEMSAVLTRLRSQARFDQARRISYVDGVRVEFEDAFALLRASRLEEVLVLEAEGTSQATVARARQALLQAAAPLAPALAAHL
ncbi:hypothetical protein [Bordetella genomosp. 1]|uniref:Phosphomannomutase/phosphoglucomutase n=1 Tax=Bordetella genomosp. 1 TaxID=1395607 RepID=A0ABX4ETG7_9BORD|nr:hypothetical protein [Bordetella genomosp. 1]OZI57062.1 hypothetical protein CAL27_22660 [Bordetella genomosp. 1]